MSSRTTCLRPPVMMSPPKATNLSTGRTPEPHSSPPIGEPEIRSISFRESLRFFQEQFISSTPPTPSATLRPLKIRLRPVLTKTNDEPEAAVDETLETKETNVNFTSSDIPPIPTVETILESVRILRAIQRSQAQGGTVWTLECDDVSQLDSILSLNDNSLSENGDSDLQVNVSQLEGFPSLDSNVSSANGLTGSVNAQHEDQNPFLISSLDGEESKVTNLCAFWPKAMTNMAKHNVDFNNLMLFDDKCNDLSKNVTEEICNTVNAASRDCMNICLPPDVDSKKTSLESTTNLEHSRQSLSGDVLENSNETESVDSCLCDSSVSSNCPNDHYCGIFVNGLAEGLVPYSSPPTFHDPFGDSRTRHRDTSPSAFDSGIVTDKSRESLSPSSLLSHFAETEVSGGDSWTESSHYDSAEGSPFVSFFEAAVAQSMANGLGSLAVSDSKPDSKSVNNARQKYPVCDSSGDEQGSGICEGNLDDTDMDFDTCNSSMCETDNATSPELSEQDLLVCSYYQQSGSISPKLSEDIQGSKLLDALEDHPKSLEDVQRDRLVEVVEDSLTQVHYIPTEEVTAKINVTGSHSLYETENLMGDPISEALNTEVSLENSQTDRRHRNIDSDFGSDDNGIVAIDSSNILFNSAITELEKLGFSTAFGAVQSSENLGEIDDQNPKLSDTLCEASESEIEKQNLDVCKLLNDLSANRSAENHNICDNIKTPCGALEPNNAEVVENQDTCGDIKTLDNLCRVNGTLDKTENQDTQKSLGAIKSHSDGTVLENQVCVSKMTCTLSRENSLVAETEDNMESTDERPKKAPTLLWDPVLLLQCLYTLDQNTFYQHFDGTDEKHSGMLKILPLGSFSGIGGFYYVVLEKSYFYCYESSDTEEPLLCIPLQYAIITVYDKHTVVLDNRQGRCVHMQFEFESNLDEWCTALESHCIPRLSSEYVEPVHYPLKCHRNVIIVDLGSCSTRAGILMDQPTLPAVYFPTVCATVKKINKQIYGLEALHPEVRQNSVLSFPVRTSAKVTKFTMDIDMLKGLFEKVFHDLGVTDPTSFTLEICIPRALSIQAQAALVKLLFDDLKVKSVSLTRQALLTLYAHNTSTGIVVDIGDRMDILPVVDGFILENGVSRLPYGGQRIIHHLKHSLAQKHVSLSNEVESYLVQYIMENLCYIAEDYEKELQYAASFPESVKKSLPLHPFFQSDSVLSNVSLDVGRFQVPEGLFNPDLWGLDSPGLHKLVYQAIQSSGVDVRRHITESIYVSGGVTMLPGFVERLQAEIYQLTKPRLKPQIHASPHRNHMAYLGACKLAASEAFPQVCITTEEWTQFGPKCLKKWHL